MAWGGEATSSGPDTSLRSGARTGGHPHGRAPEPPLLMPREAPAGAARGAGQAPGAGRHPGTRKHRPAQCDFRTVLAQRPAPGGREGPAERSSGDTWDWGACAGGRPGSRGGSHVRAAGPAGAVAVAGGAGPWPLEFGKLWPTISGHMAWTVPQTRWAAEEAGPRPAGRRPHQPGAGWASVGKRSGQQDGDAPASGRAACWAEGQAVADGERSLGEVLEQSPPSPARPGPWLRG